jgi:hypothetical protein
MINIQITRLPQSKYRTLKFEIANLPWHIHSHYKNERFRILTVNFNKLTDSFDDMSAVKLGDKNVRRRRTRKKTL